MHPPLTGEKSKPGHKRHTHLLVMVLGTRNSLLYLVLSGGKEKVIVCDSKLWTNIAAYRLRMVISAILHITYKKCLLLSAELEHSSNSSE